MVTNYPHQVAQRDHQVAGADRADDGFGTRVMSRVRQVFCGIHGHDSLLQFEQDRLFLKCASCGYESPGWALNEAPEGTDVPAQAPQRVAVRPHLAGARRIA
jgi:hypothetical protein